jgi:hypothetical protein
MCNMIGPAGQAGGLAETDDRTLDLVYEEIATLEQIPEDAAESLRIDAIERQEPFDEFVCVDAKQRLLIRGASDPQHGRSFALERVSSPLRAGPARKPSGQPDEVDGFNHRLNGRCRMAAHGAQITELVDQK